MAVGRRSLRFFSAYQFAAPLAILPASYWLWLGRYEGSHGRVLFVLGLPVVFAYVVPGIGANVLRLWEFDTRWRWGRIRPYHGLVFGAASSMCALLVPPRPASEVGGLEILRAGVVLGSFMAFWNLLYDISAVKAGFIRVYNRPFHEGRGPEAVVSDYAPVLFGAFGFCYGALVRAGEWYSSQPGPKGLGGLMVAVSVVFTVVIPVAAFVLLSYARYGESGLHAYRETLG